MKIKRLIALFISFFFALNCFAQKQNALAAGGTHVLAICTNSTSITSWGLNTNGELGDGTLTSVGGCGCGGKIPSVICSAAANPCWADMRWMSIKAGYHFSMALSSTGSPCGPLNPGSVWVWGLGSSGQMGNGGTISNNATPIRTNNGGMGNNTFVAIAAGAAHWLALKNDNTIRACGANYYGQIGDGTTTTTGCNCISTPVQVDATNFSTAGRTISKIAAGGSHSIALCSDNTVWCWGLNAYGQCGNDLTTPLPNPRQVNLAALGGRIVADIAGNAYSTYVRCTDGTVWAWGWNARGQIGDGTVGGVGCYWSCGNGADCCKATPTQVAGLTNVVDIGNSGRSETAIAIKSDGSVWVWGWDDNGMLGNNTVADGSQTGTPVRVQNTAGTGWLEGTWKILAAHIGEQYSAFVKSNGTIWAVGDNCAGQCDNSCTDRSLPVQVTPICGGATSVLPVKIISFSASFNSRTVLCQWSTASETNNDYFQVERSTDEVTWNVAGTVKGSGNSSMEKNYEFTDLELPPATDDAPLYYRLRQVDFNGDFQYFGPVAVSVLNELGLVLKNIFSDNQLSGMLDLPNDAPVRIEITDLQGRIIRTEQTNAFKGENLIHVDLLNVENGCYIIKVQNSHTQIQKRFVKI